ncbi:hypothetical protein LJB42_001949 [Komagataella kurtzmanii]|nr:hypothetical protein LJB42_001949 [Komagataella kurtzmanii]
MKSVLVTGGATVTFVALLQLTLNEKFISALKKNNFDKLVVQYGTQPTGESLFLSLINKLTDEDYKKSQLGQLYNIKLKDGFLIQGLSFDTDFVKNYTSKVDLVISHGGTGSILDTLRAGKKLVVVVNDTLADNHQLELTEKFAEREVLGYCRKNTVEELIDQVNQAESREFKRLAPSKGRIIQDVILNNIIKS